MELKETIDSIGMAVALLSMLGWTIYKIFTKPKQTKRFIFRCICHLSLLVGSYSIFYQIYTLFVGGFDLRYFWYFTVIPLTIGSSIRDSIIDIEDYPFWGNFKNSLTITGYLIVLDGLSQIGLAVMNDTLRDNVPLIFVPIIIGSVPILINIYSQADNENNQFYEK